MTEIVLFHHAQGLTSGVHAFADQLRTAGHSVSVPDLYDGATFADLQLGVDHAEEIGFEEIIDRGVAAADQLPAGGVVMGFSLGALPAQKLAQTRAGVAAAVLYAGGVSSATFGTSWPAAVALQIHQSEHDDDWTELDVNQALVAEAADGELFLYPGAGHLISDNSLPSYEPANAELILQRVLAFLRRLSD